MEDYSVGKLLGCLQTDLWKTSAPIWCSKWTVCPSEANMVEKMSGKDLLFPQNPSSWSVNGHVTLRGRTSRKIHPDLGLYWVNNQFNGHKGCRISLQSPRFGTEPEKREAAGSRGMLTNFDIKRRIFQEIRSNVRFWIMTMELLLGRCYYFWNIL